ncbi:unnamed protein product [Prorocentrum cordatum]|uniref:Peptidase A1 domain-containing protein n=1 Tax=Prorocentrum cordatum TaxID=2364126 RepID=A0ABN9X9T5_9DINO|nr:unnamed protein product [Polarella glacialis]
MARAALRAALAAATCRAALALHSALGSQSDEALHLSLEEALGPSGGSAGRAEERARHVPAAVVAELEGRRRELERLQDDAGPAAAALGAASAVRRHGLPREKSLWLSGKSRQAMTNYNDVQYVGFVEVGGQTISGIFDTGSFDLVVFSEVCQTCGQAARYNPALSASHTQGKLTSSQGYGSGTVVSQDAFDIVSVGPYTPRNQSFWEVTDADMPVLAYSMFQSIIGLGPPEAPLVDAEDRLAKLLDNISSYTGAGRAPPADLAKAEAHTRAVAVAMQTRTMVLESFESKMFSICLGRQPNSDGYVIWSDTAPLVKPDYFQRVRVTGNHTWSTTLGEPKFEYDPAVNDKQFDKDNKFNGLTLGCENGCGALLDSGTSLLAMPGNLVNELVRLTLEPGFNCSNLWELPSIKFKLGGQEVVLPPDAYISEVDDSLGVPAYLQSFVRLRRVRGRASQELRPRLQRGRGAEAMGSRRGSESQRPGARCDLVVMVSSADSVHGPLWILGVPFFRQYYTTFEVSGRSNENRAVHLAKASDTCHPASPDEHLKFPPRTQLGKRLIDPTKLWMTPSTYSALSSDYVFL